MSEIAVSLSSMTLMVAAALGAGAWALRLTRADALLDPNKLVATAFVLGVGILGWFVFIPALTDWLQPLPLAAICLALATGIIWLRRSHYKILPTNKILSPLGVTLILSVGIALLFNVITAFAPPADADSLAYHFARPRDFLAAGKVVFIPRATDGVHPLIQQMSYVAALGLGGQRALTLWTMISGWGATAILYTFARSHLSREWSLALVLVFLTTPAVVYGSVSGQVEIRNAGFVLASVLLAMGARRHDRLYLSALSGLAAGFFAASKYTGLLFLPVVGIVLIAQPRWFKHGLAYATATLLAIVPFYGWIWWNTGDPVYPMLFGLVDYKPGVFWSADIQAEFRRFFESEKSIPSTFFWAVLYPFLTVLSPSPAFESGRTGFGPFALMLLPLALAGLWARRKTLGSSHLWTAAFVCSGFYFAWFIFGQAQRIRHFLPVYPLLLLCVTIAAVRACDTWRFLAKPMGGAIAVVAILQLAIQGMFTLNPTRYVFSEESSDAFLLRNLSNYDAAVWVNSHLGAKNRILTTERQLMYYLPIGSFYGVPAHEPRIDLRSSAQDVGRFWNELAIEKITHLLIPAPGATLPQAGYEYMARQLIRMHCAQTVASLKTRSFESRTIAAATQSPGKLEVLALTPQSCSLEYGGQ